MLATFKLIKSDNSKLDQMVKDIIALTKKEVLVGVPEDKSTRDPDIWFEKGSIQVRKPKINNATLAAIHDNGSPKQNIPARPFMKPGIAKAQDRINKGMLQAAKAQLNKDSAGVAKAFEKVGLVAQAGIRNVINEGEGFSPLQRSTLLGRLRRRKAAKKWTKDKRENVMESMHPLIDTGQLRNSISYVVVDK